MELVTADIVQARQGEAAFILQLRPPVIDNADELALALEQFTSRYLKTAPGDEVRFAPLGALTWALSAPGYQIEAVDQACDGLAEALFGDRGSQAVHLARQPDSAPSVTQEHVESEDEGQSWTAIDPVEPLLEQEEALDAEAESWGFPQDIAQADEGGDPASDVGGDVAVEDLEASEPLPGDEAEWDVAMPELAATNEQALEADVVMDADDTDADEKPGLDTDPDQIVEEGWDLAEASEEIVDLDGFEPLSEPVLREEDSQEQAPGDVSAFDDLDLSFDEPVDEDRVEAPEPLDLAAEIAAFRQEMTEIAQSIPAGSGDAGLSEFRAELENLTGELGQRVDGAAQRIETAVDRMDPDRFLAASARVEQAADLIETSVQTALQALNGANSAMIRSEAGEDGQNITISG